MSNINDIFFDGQYKEVWRAIIPPELTVKEVDFMVSYFNLKPGSKVLDIMCGYGRHAIALAEKGIEVTAIDNLGDYIEEIKTVAAERALPIKAIKADAATYTPEESFDLAICMGNSLNFFNAKDTQNILNNIATHLNTGGHLLINSWSIAEIAIRTFKESTTGQLGGAKLESTSSFLFHPTRIETVSTMTTFEGRTETKTAIDYVFSIGEIEMIANNAGLQVRESYSIPGRRKFSLGEARVYLIAAKNE